MYGLTSTCAILALLAVLRKKRTIWPFFGQKPWFSRSKKCELVKKLLFLLNFDIKNNNRGVKWLNEAKNPSRTLENSITWVFGFKVVMARFYPCGLGSFIMWRWRKIEEASCKLVQKHINSELEQFNHYFLEFYELPTPNIFHHLYLQNGLRRTEMSQNSRKKHFCANMGHSGVGNP